MWIKHRGVHYPDGPTPQTLGSGARSPSIARGMCLCGVPEPSLPNGRDYQLACFGRGEVEELVGAVALRLPDLNRVLIDRLRDDAQPGWAAVQASSMLLDELPQAATVFPKRFARVVLAKDPCEVTEESVSAPGAVGVIPAFRHALFAGHGALLAPLNFFTRVAQLTQEGDREG